LFVTVAPPHRPAHATPSSTQHVPSAMQTAPPTEHWPLVPHATICPQLFVAVPHFFVPHVTASGSGVHPQAPAVHAPPSSQPPQLTGRAQLSVVSPQRFLHQVPSETHWHLPSAQVRPNPQVEAQVRGLWQLSVTTPHFSAHVMEFGSGLQELVAGPASVMRGSGPPLDVAGVEASLSAG
jgi:hypothetical protein